MRHHYVRSLGVKFRVSSRRLERRSQRYLIAPHKTVMDSLAGRYVIEGFCCEVQVLQRYGFVQKSMQLAATFRAPGFLIVVVGVCSRKVIDKVCIEGIAANPVVHDRNSVHARVQVMRFSQPQFRTIASIQGPQGSLMRPHFRKLRLHTTCLFLAYFGNIAKDKGFLGARSSRQCHKLEEHRIPT